jgi:hypothetical protein
VGRIDLEKGIKTPYSHGIVVKFPYFEAGKRTWRAYKWFDIPYFIFYTSIMKRELFRSMFEAAVAFNPKVLYPKPGTCGATN